MGRKEIAKQLKQSWESQVSTSDPDSRQMIVRNNITALYDKGYHSGSEFDTANMPGIETIVAIPKVAAQAPDPRYNAEHFQYDKTNDYYICPQGKILTSTGKTRPYFQTILKTTISALF